jgi:nitrate/nitrite transporter NarK
MGGAIMNSIGNLGGFVGPYLIGALYDSTHSYFPAMYTMGAGLVLAAAMVTAYQPHWSEKRAMPNQHLADAAAAANALEKGKAATELGDRSVDGAGKDQAQG